MRFKDYLLTEDDNGNSYLMFKSKGTLKVNKPLKMYSKNGRKFVAFGLGTIKGEPIVEMDIEVFGDQFSDQCIARISYDPPIEGDPDPQTYYTYINTDTYEEMKQALDNLFE